MKSILKIFIFAVLVQATLQQSLSCIFCQDCFGANSQWIERDCNNDDPIGNPTTPGPIFPMAAQSIDSNDTTSVATPTFVDPSLQNWQCYALTYNLNGRDSVARGCIRSHGSHDNTCANIRPGARVVWCELCDDRNNCNSSSYIYVSTFLLISALLLIVKL